MSAASAVDADAVTAAVRAKVETLQAQLLAKVEANLSGDILQSHTGALKSSILASITDSGAQLTATIASVGVPYAAIQEYGGHTAAHAIMPVKAKALAFAGAAGPTFARRVYHPGSAIPGRAYLGDALGALRAEIETGLKSAVRGALGVL